MATGHEKRTVNSPAMLAIAAIVLWLQPWELPDMSPDLQLRILVDNLDWDRAEQIAQATQVAGAVPIGTGPRRSFFRPRPRLSSWSVHDLLAESADWDAETWDMEAPGLPRLVHTFEILFQQIPEAFAVEVLWVGDHATEIRSVSREQMLDSARQGKFGTKTRYLVDAAASSAYVI